MTGKALAFSILLLAYAGPCARADVVYLRNGRSMEGIITEETDSYIQLAVGIGNVKFFKTQISDIERSSPEENKQMANNWERERVLKEREKKKSQSGIYEIDIIPQDGQALVRSTLNEEVQATLALDTGSTLVVLSSETAARLKIDVAGMKPDVKMLLASGKEAPAKLFVLESLSIGEVLLKDVDAAIVFSKGAFKKFDGLLGMSFLKFFKFEVDMDKKTLILEKRKGRDDER